MNEISRQGARHIPYDSADFDYGKNKLSPENWGDLGFAGFRAHYPLNGREYKDELVVFLGASYFRALGAGPRYGLSARGLAVDTVGGQGEEFPEFTEFWIVRPAADANTLRCSRCSIRRARAARISSTCTPGDETVMDVRARIYLRAQVATLGVAPLTSMFFFGENQPHRTDFRPEVHDSDGLMVATGDGEWLWRPLLNPNANADHVVLDARAARLRSDAAGPSFAATRTPRRATSCGRAPGSSRSGSWGPGRVELVQLHTPDETNDNIVAYWVPEKLPRRGQPLDFAYRLHWQGARIVQRPPGAWVMQTRVGRGYRELADDEQQFIVDFTGPSLAALPPSAPSRPWSRRLRTGRSSRATPTASRPRARGA